MYLPGFDGLKIKSFGGSLLKGNPRDARPISTKRPIHLVMRSSLARGRRSFLSPAIAQRIQRLVYRLARNRGITIYRFANSGNHLHIIARTPSRESYRGYVRALSGIIARITLGVERGKSKGLRFWDARPFTRIIEWGREYKIASKYVTQNLLEALGFIPYQERKDRGSGREPIPK